MRTASWNKGCCFFRALCYYEFSINWVSNSFIIDQVFHHVQTIDFGRWKTENDRWVGLSQSNNSDGTVDLNWFDKISLRVNGNIITDSNKIEDLRKTLAPKEKK